jgi:thiol-disulfide isomerase/thioredoxin
MNQETNEWKTLIKKADELFHTTKHPQAIKLAREGQLPTFGGATTWLNSQPLSAEDLRGKVVLIDFWTYTCINWLRTLPYVRAWAEKYQEQGLVVIGVHTPEFPFEHDLANVRQAAQAMRIEYAIAIDNDYAVWQAFNNHYWPALYIADAQGQIRYHHFGEGNYAPSEMVIQQLLSEIGKSGIGSELVSVEGKGLEAAADWASLRSFENYLGYERSENFASFGGAISDQPQLYTAPAHLTLNHWALSGNWTVGEGYAILNQGGGRLVYRFEARDLNLVMGPSVPGNSIRFRVLLDGQAPGAAGGSDLDEQGYGTLSEQRLYQLIRQPRPIRERQFEIEFSEAGAEVFVFTFG